MQSSLFRINILLRVPLVISSLKYLCFVRWDGTADGCRVPLEILQLFYGSHSSFDFNIYFNLQFFVASDPTVKTDRLWHDKYTLRKSMIPSFITMEQSKKVYI